MEQFLTIASEGVSGVSTSGDTADSGSRITVIGSNFSAIFSEEMEQREKEANAKKEEEAGADPKERLVGELRRVLKAHGAEFSNKPLKLVLLSGDDVTAISTN